MSTMLRFRHLKLVYLEEVNDAGDSELSLVQSIARALYP